ncbi:uncharacterized protein LOC132755782 [Ruditapes philippinarum]|uniref:uncharacterized protein LOC132755782 n=1 Tax=Ruditapes philippinarum TaxID=129788 RepID=UPI00295C1809|nr:uncharacterized protein LOC132755782 [Ruditapes philippinarum]
MSSGKYLYRILRDDEESLTGLSARNPEMTNVTVSAHVNGLKKSPNISTSASKKALRAYANFRMAVQNSQREQQNNGPAVKDEHFTAVEINKDQLIMDKGKEIQIFDLSRDEERDKYLTDGQKQFAAKYEEVLIMGFVPAEYVKVIDVKVMSDDEFIQYSNKTDFETELIAGNACQLNVKNL